MLKKLRLGGMWLGVVMLVPSATLAQDAANPVSQSIRAQYQPVKNNIVAAAHQVPEELYSFRPTEDVRSFGELIGHLAFAQFNICSGLLDQPSPRPGNREQTLSTKADLVAAIEEAFAFCDEAYATATDASLADEVSFFGGRSIRHYPLTFALVHANEHYGNIVTYMRLNDMVPPSSQGS